VGLYAGMRLGPVSYIYARIADMYLKKRREGVSCELYSYYRFGKLVSGFEEDMYNVRMSPQVVCRLIADLEGDLHFLASKYEEAGFRVEGSVSEKPEHIELVLRVREGEER